MRTQASDHLILDTNLQTFFHGLLETAAQEQKLAARDDTLQYLVHLLSGFSRAGELFEQTPDGLMLRPLAELYGEAVNSQHLEVRRRALQRLGDLALFISGVFPHSLSRKPVDVDYYIAMGGGAYSVLSDAPAETVRWRSLKVIFLELATNFTAFVDLLARVCQRAHFHDDSDVLRLYELWLRTGSRRTAQVLRGLGIEPLAAGAGRLQ